MVAFQNIMKDPRSKEILDQAQKSRGESSDGITVWRVTDHPKWLDVEKEASLKQSLNELEDGNNDANAVRDEDYHVALKNFEANHPAVKASIQDDGSNIIEVNYSSCYHGRFLPDPSQLTITLRRSNFLPHLISTSYSSPNQFLNTQHRTQ